MNREIKFRAKELIHNQWIYGGIAEDRKGNTVILPKNDWSKGGCVDVGTVGQFTGLHDKCGKEIYEGDIVQWDECVADYTFVTQSSEVFYDDRSASFMPFGEWHSSDFEIIGNVFDNPELLEE